MAILKIPRSWPGLQFSRTPAIATPTAVRGSNTAEGLDAFGSEFDPATHLGSRGTPHAPDPTPWKSGWVRTATKWVAVVALSAAVAVVSFIAYQRRPPAAVTTGQVTFETAPSGLDIVVGGKLLGKTPLTSSFAPGAYDVQVGSASGGRPLRINVTAGASVVQRVEFAPQSHQTAPATGGLRIQTEPVRLPVHVDGTSRGLSPVSIDNVEPGEHEIVVRTPSGVTRRTVSLKAGETLSLLLSPANPAPDPAAVSAGWISVSTPVPVQLREGGKLIGTSESERLMLAAGDHDIEFANAPLGFSVRRAVRVTAGKTVAIKVDLPNGLLSINAQPWAEVWIDGERIGETPIGNLSRPIGTHDVLFRHPELGERRETVTLAVGKPTRIGVDLRKK